MSSNGETASVASSTSDDPKDKYQTRDYFGTMKSWNTDNNGPINDSYGVIECKNFKGKENVEFFVHISELKFLQKENAAADNYFELSKAAQKCPNVTFQVGNLKKKALNVRLHNNEEGKNNSLGRILNSYVPIEEPTYWKFNERGEAKTYKKTKN